MNYRKLDVAMLDSTIWLEDVPTRIVWLTLLLTMNQEYVAEFSSVRNLAARANVSDEEAIKAVSVLESPDPESHSKREEGRRIIRVAGGWFVVNGDLYQEWALIELARTKNRERVRRHRAKSLQVADVTNVPITSVTPPITHKSVGVNTNTLLREETSFEKGESNPGIDLAIYALQKLGISRPTTLERDKMADAINDRVKNHGESGEAAADLICERWGNSAIRKKLPGISLLTWLGNRHYNEDGRGKSAPPGKSPSQQIREENEKKGIKYDENGKPILNIKRTFGA